MATPRQTSVWVPIDRVVCHPRNPNHLPEETKKKLYASWDEGGHLAPLIVRSLELTQEFLEDRDADKLQLLDGEQRWTYCVERGRTEVEVRIWEGVSDQRAAQYLAALNRLRGRDLPRKRRELVQYLSGEYDHEELAARLPENLPDIVRMIEEESREAVARATDIAEGLAMRQPLAWFVSQEQHQTIKQAIKAKLEEMDPEHQIHECREGAALAALCAGYLSRQSGASAVDPEEGGPGGWVGMDNSEPVTE